MCSSCPFCEILQSSDSTRIIASNDLALAISDGYPVSNGHTLIITRRHEASFFEITNEERLAMLELLDQVKNDLNKECKPDAYNIGINDGSAAGQTVSHLHIHLIPRYEGDADDPRGGVRWVIPDKADYWSGNP